MSNTQAIYVCNDRYGKIAVRRVIGRACLQKRGGSAEKSGHSSLLQELQKTTARLNPNALAASVFCFSSRQMRRMHPRNIIPIARFRTYELLRKLEAMTGSSVKSIY
jgi:hypothetical protein